MGRDPSSMTVSNIEGPIIGVSYIRKNDGTKWSYKCKIDGNKIVWGNSDGRWRESSEDSVITYKLTGNSIVVSETYSDGSKNTKNYKNGALGE